MNWISALVIRLALGLIIGLAAFAGFWLVIVNPEAIPQVSPSWLLLLPILGGTGIAFLLVDGITTSRWSRKWLPLADGSRAMPERPERSVRRAVRELTSPAIYPSLARTRLARFLSQLTETTLRRQVRDEWVWDLYLLTWPWIRDRMALAEHLRSALKGCDSWNVRALRIALAALKSAPEDHALEMRAARASLDLDVSGFTPEELEILERAWLSGMRLPELRPLLLPHLVRRFLMTGRRDEVAADIYLDASGSLGITPELPGEMARTADTLEISGGDPEIVAALRALAAEHGASVFNVAGLSERTFKPGAVAKIPHSSAARRPRDPEPSQVIRFDFLSDAEPASENGETITMTPVSLRRSRRRIWLLVVAGIMLLAIMLAAVALLSPGGERQPETQTATRGPVHSDLPYTLQVAALPTRERAVALIRDLRRNKQDAYLVTSVSSDKTWYRVHLGHFTTVEEADTCARRLVSMDLINESYVARFEPGEIPPELDAGDH